ncbi:unnamed protein product [Vitrella brassicaformis CCMP3155]|uniref:Uncharacterized protein n=1 Tax=Vitrella brassicaformis (strain CCMP3155) TaxID=1169540 RepID=A0A0G4FPC9_VITBC|nr:unnamed protein product [Vitrella brassicaformis CCMP3155]|eukprot:CEM15858.1 unnamed protein product [Vitrella brassicaformis CCMP3155]
MTSLHTQSCIVPQSDGRLTSNKCRTLPPKLNPAPIVGSTMCWRCEHLELARYDRGQLLGLWKEKEHLQELVNRWRGRQQADAERLNKALNTIEKAKQNQEILVAAAAKLEPQCIAAFILYPWTFSFHFSGVGFPTATDATAAAPSTASSSAGLRHDVAAPPHVPTMRPLERTPAHRRQKAPAPRPPRTPRNTWPWQTRVNPYTCPPCLRAQRDEGEESGEEGGQQERAREKKGCARDFQAPGSPSTAAGLIPSDGGSPPLLVALPDSPQPPAAQPSH